MTQIEAMKQALEALEYYDFANGVPQRAAEALRAAIAEQERCEPVAIVGELCDQSRADAIRRGYSVGQYMFTYPAPVPAGWQLVPVEPTKAMLSAGWGNDHLYADLYKTMLQAAPKPGEMK